MRSSLVSASLWIRPSQLVRANANAACNCPRFNASILLRHRKATDEIVLYIQRKKSFSIFPSPAGMSLTKLSLGGNVIYKLFPPRENLLSDIPAGDGNIEKLFYGVGAT
jgi:hypothetical protein